MNKKIEAPVCVTVNGHFLGGMSDKSLSTFLRKIDTLRKMNLIRLKAYVDKKINRVRSIRLILAEADMGAIKKFCLRHRRKIA